MTSIAITVIASESSAPSIAVAYGHGPACEAAMIEDSIPGTLPEGSMPRPIRSLQVIEATQGGAARHVLDLVIGLAELGQEVVLVYSPMRADPWFIEELAGREELTTRALSLTRSPGPRDLPAMLALRKIISELGPFDILHGHSSKAGALVRMAGLGTGAKLFYTANGFRTADPTLGKSGRWIYGLIERILANRFGDQVICVSEWERRHALSFGFDPSRLAVIPNGLAPIFPLSRAEARRRVGMAAEGLAIGFVGRLNPQKNPLALLELADALNQHNVPASLEVVGDGPMFEELARECNRRNLTSRMTLHGFHQGQEILTAFDLFVLPSHYEGFPYVLLEALESGVPIVSTEIGGAEELLSDGKVGRLVPVGDTAAFVAAAIELLSDRQLLGSMSQEAPKVARRFTAERMVRETLSCYAQALGLYENS